MAKTPSKTPAKKVAKKAAAAPKSKTSAPSIEKVSEETLKKLHELGLDSQLQADLEWCLGSYKADKNPAGLYDMLEKALSAFTAAKENKTKGITTKLTGDVEKILKSR
jgi:hypothetical protein